MADSIIGALRVVLGLDTAAFSAGAKEAQSSLDKLAAGFKTALAGLAAGAILAQITSSIKGVIDQAVELGKVSEKFGIPVEQLSALKYAAEQSEVSFDSLSKGLGKFSKAMLDAVVNPSGQAAKAFQSIGISASQLNLNDVQGSLEKVADKFSTLGPGADKAGVAMKLFGKAGADMIPLLNKGSDGIQALIDKANDLGIVISAKTAEDALQFNNTLKDIQASSQAFWIQLTAALLPALQQLATFFNNAQREGGFLKSLIPNLITDADIATVQRLGQGFENLGRIWDAFKAIGLARTWDEMQTAAAGLTAAVEANRKALEDLDRAAANAPSFKGFLDNINEGIRAGEQYAASLNHVNTAVMGGKNALDQFIQSQQKSLAAQQAQAQTVGAAVGTQEAMRVTMEGQAIALAHNITMTDAQRVALKNLSDQAGAAAIQLKGAQLTQEMLSPWDLYAQKVRDVNIELANNAISAATAQKASAKAASDMTSSYGQAAATAAGNFATFFTTFANGNETMFAVGKAFSISQAIINTYVAATKALAELGPVFGPIAAAGMIASGLAMVATIIAQKPAAKAAMGGQFKVGGAGGTDSQMVPIMMTPGERVSVDQNKYGESSGSNRTITLQGLKPKEYYRGDVLRDFVDNLNQAIGDGLKIKLA